MVGEVVKEWRKLIAAKVEKVKGIKGKGCR